MKIVGLQKLTLLDYPGRAACTVFTCGCNFRCPFCQNSDLVLPGASSESLDLDEFFAFLKKRAGLLDGICISGGEPLLHPDIDDLMEKAKKLGYLVKLDTNGSFPEKLKDVVDKKLVDYVAMDIKNSPEGYSRTIGVENFDISSVKESAAFLMTGVVEFEFRTTVVREFHRKEDFRFIGSWLHGGEKYFLQAFQDSGSLIQPGLHGYSKAEMEEFRDILKSDIPHVALRGV